MNDIIELKKIETLSISLVIALILMIIFISGEITHPNKRIEHLTNQIKLFIGISNFLGLGIMLFSIMVIDND